MLKIRILFSVLFMCSLYIGISQDSLTYPEKSFLRKDQRWRIDIPIWVPGLRGEFSQGEVGIEAYNFEEPPDQKERKLLNWLFPTQAYLEFYLIGRITYQNKKFVSALDFMSGKFGTSVYFRLTNKEIIQASLGVQLPRLILGYQVFEYENKKSSFRVNITPYTGIRYYFVNVSSKSTNLINNINSSINWGDGLIGLIVPVKFHRWQFIIQGDYGGFGFDNSRSWIVHFNSKFRISKLVSVHLGWNNLDIRHSGSYKGENVDLNIHLYGPMAGVSFHF